MTDQSNGTPLSRVSTSGAWDGSFIAISEFGALLAGASHRLLGGVAVGSIGTDRPISATADGEFAVSPHASKCIHIRGAC